MKKMHFLWLVIMMSFSLFVAPIEMNAEAQEPLEDSSRYVVIFNGEHDFADIEESGVKLIREYENIHGATIELENSKLESLKDNKAVEIIEKESVVEINAQVTPYAFTNLNMTNKYPNDLTGKGIKVAVIDSGVATHPDLKIKAGVCVLDSSDCYNSYHDNNGHGTHVAGIIAALDNDIGTVGVAPGVEIYAVKALDRKGEGTLTTIMAGIDWAISQKVDIINLSLSTPNLNPAMKTLLDQAYKNGILVIAATGNEGTASGDTDTVQYPARFDSVIAVSAVNKNNVRLPTSGTGDSVELAAPGDAVYSTVPGGYMYMSGTSMAAPYVSGLAALYMEKYPHLSNVEIRELLRENALDLGTPGRDRFYGYGLAQVDSAHLLPEPVIGSDGSVKLDLKDFLSKYPSYNLYRFDQLIVSNSSNPTVYDYGVQGDVEYTVYPVEDGMEQTSKKYKAEVTLTAPHFKDLTNSLWYSRHMIYLNSQSILLGLGDQLMGPTQQVTRAQAVAMMGRALELNKTQRKTRFSDVGKNNFASGYIESAAEQGYLSGFPDGTFRPDQPVTRAEMAILLSKGFGLANSHNTSFSDVNGNVTGAQEIANIAGSGITLGYPDGTFRPYEYMTRATFSVFLARAENDFFR